MIRFAFLLAFGSTTPIAAQHSFEVGEGLRVNAPQGQLEWRLGGRLHLDSAQFNSDITPLADDTAIRRARIGFRARVGSDWRVAADYDFDGAVEGWKVVNAQYRGFDNLRITFGSQVAPFGMEQRTGSSDLQFLERGLPNALTPGLLTGVSLQTAGDAWVLTGGLFGNAVDDLERREADGRGVVARFTATPLRRGKTIVHFGVAGESRSLDDDRIRLRSRPESALTDVRLIDTLGIENVDDIASFGLEFAARTGPFSLQAEHMQTEIARSLGSDLSFSGGYVAVGYVVTGESLSYSRRSGAFGGIEPRHLFGAIEVVARLSTLDLNSGLTTGGEQRNRTVGVNWYVRERLRLMLNYTMIDARPNRLGIDESPSLWQLRFQAHL